MGLCAGILGAQALAVGTIFNTILGISTTLGILIGMGSVLLYSTSGIFAFFFYFVTASIGLVALVLYPNIEPDQAIPTAVKNILPIGITGLVVAALLAVIQSTASSYLNSTAVVFVRDIYQPFIAPNLSERRRLWLQRIVTLVVGAAAILFALSAPSIVDALLYSYSLWAPTVIIPLVLAVVWGFRSEVAALSAIIGGGVTAAVWTWVLNEPFGVTGLVAGIVINIAAFAIAYMAFGKKESRSAALVSEGE